jgi:sulfite exporter TauE/SafE
MWWTAIILGLGGSFHCAGMCGPLIMAVPAKGNRVKFIVKKSLYNLGRITTYSLLGVIVGFLGEGLDLAGLQRYASLISGVSLLLILSGGLKKSSGGMIYNFIKKGLGKVIQQNGMKSHYIFGVLNGFLPCGLTIFALIAALAQSSLLDTVFYMVLFGIGTIPMMTILPLFGTPLLNFTRKKFNYKIAVFSVATLLILRGLNLGIHYVSPQVKNMNTDIEEIDLGNCQ